MNGNSENPYSPPQSEVSVGGQKSKSAGIAWIAFGIFCVVGIYGNLFIPALRGISPQTNFLFPSMISHAILLIGISKRHEKDSWNGAVIGAFAGMAMYAIAALTSGAMR